MTNQEFVLSQVGFAESILSILTLYLRLHTNTFLALRSTPLLQLAFQFQDEIKCERLHASQLSLLWQVPF
jgi:hypothetical protein